MLSDSSDCNGSMLIACELLEAIHNNIMRCTKAAVKSLEITGEALVVQGSTHCNHSGL